MPGITFLLSEVVELFPVFLANKIYDPDCLLLWEYLGLGGGGAVLPGRSKGLHPKSTDFIDLLGALDHNVRRPHASACLLGSTIHKPQGKRLCRGSWCVSQGTHITWKIPSTHRLPSPVFSHDQAAPAIPSSPLWANTLNLWAFYCLCTY